MSDTWLPSLGFGLLWAPMIRRLSAVVLIVILTAAVWPFGRSEIIGHGLIMAILLAVAADHSRNSQVLAHSRTPRGTSRWRLPRC